MTSVTFETATLADVIRRVDRVAPRKGAAYDTASGFIVEINPELNPPVVIKATDMITFIMEWVDAVAVKGPAVTWRIPSVKFATLVGGLPIGSGKTVTLTEVRKDFGRHLEVKSGTTKAKFNIMMNDYYPVWDAFDPDDLQVVNDLGSRLKLVDWATDKSLAPFNSILFTGEKLVATDKFRIASCDFKMQLPDGIGGRDDDIDLLVQSTLLSSLISKSGDIRIGLNGNQLLVMPTDTCQIRALRTDAKFPPQLSSIMSSDREEYIEFGKTEFVDISRRVSAFASSDRSPMLKLKIGRNSSTNQGSMIVYLITDDESAMMEMMDLGNQAQHQMLELWLSPDYIIPAVEKCPSDRVKIGYNVNSPTRVVYIDGGAGYKAWIAQRTVPKTGDIEAG